MGINLFIHCQGNPPCTWIFPLHSSLVISLYITPLLYPSLYGFSITLLNIFIYYPVSEKKLQDSTNGNPIYHIPLIFLLRVSDLSASAHHARGSPWGRCTHDRVLFPDSSLRTSLYMNMPDIAFYHASHINWRTHSPNCTNDGNVPREEGFRIAGTCLKKSRIFITNICQSWLSVFEWFVITHYDAWDTRNAEVYGWYLPISVSLLHLVNKPDS